MQYFKPEMNKPVRVVWDGKQPNVNDYGKHEYVLDVEGETMTYAATERMNTAIRDFCGMNGTEFAIVRIPFTKYKPDGHIDTVEPYDLTNNPQNAPAYGQKRSEYAKKQSAPSVMKDDPAFLGMCSNQAVQLVCAGKREDIEEAAREMYHLWKNINWEKEETLGEDIPSDLPFGN